MGWHKSGMVVKWMEGDGVVRQVSKGNLSLGLK